MKIIFRVMAPFLFLLSACLPAAKEARVIRDNAYADHPGADPNLTSLDVYLPTEKEGCPVVLWVHGGGWQAGDKTDLIEQKARYFVSRNFVFASANHRLFPDAEFPVFIEDVADAVGWAYENIGQYGGDPQRMILMGFSSGAHIVSLIAADGGYLSTRGVERDAIKAVVSVDSAAYDLPLLSKYYKGKLEGTHGRVFGDDPELWKAASPITYLGQADSIPPFLLAYSRGVYADEVNPNLKEQAEHFTQALQRRGFTAILSPFPAKTHQQLEERLGLPYDPLTKTIMAFLQNTAGLDLSCQTESVR